MKELVLHNNINLSKKSKAHLWICTEINKNCTIIQKLSNTIKHIYEFALRQNRTVIKGDKCPTHAVLS